MLSEAVLQYVKEDVVNVGGFERTEFVAADEGRFEMRAYPGSDCGNNIGTVHGAFLLALADMAGTGAVDTLGRENATLSLNANFLRPCARMTHTFRSWGRSFVLAARSRSRAWR